MKKKDKVDKKEDEGNEGGGLIFFIMFAIAYILAVILFHSCGNQVCDAYHRPNVSPRLHVKDTSATIKIKIHENNRFYINRRLRH